MGSLNAFFPGLVGDSCRVSMCHGMQGLGGSVLILVSRMAYRYFDRKLAGLVVSRMQMSGAGTPGGYSVGMVLVFGFSIVPILVNRFGKSSQRVL